MDYFWITRGTGNGTVEYLYNFDEINPTASTWGRYLKYREIDVDKVCEIHETLEKYYDNLDIIAFDERDDRYRFGVSASINNVGVGVFGNTLPKNLNEYCTFCKRECKQPGFVIIELCPDFIEK